MWPIIEYLKGPELVVQFQEFFGVRYINNKTSITTTSDDDEGLSSSDARSQRSNDEDSTGSDLQSHTSGLHKRNVSSGSSETDEGFNEPRNQTQHEKLHQHSAQSEIRPYEITNKFWYYLFVIGTEFGDEIFYATMIPFWFWNVDGAVGRRVVFVWAVVMYIGML